MCLHTHVWILFGYIHPVNSFDDYSSASYGDEAFQAFIVALSRKWLYGKVLHYSTDLVCGCTYRRRHMVES
jgi:hypothetical protein